MRKIITLYLFFALLFVHIIQAQSIVNIDTFNTAKTSAFTTNNFKCIGIGKNGHVWAGTQYGGLYKYNPITKTWEKSTELSNVFINDIKTDKDGGIWIAQSGQSGISGGGSNIAGGVNYFPHDYFNVMYFHSVTPGGGLSTRNVRTVWVDTSRTNGADRPRIWLAQGTFITSSNTQTGGIGLGLNGTTDYFSKIKNGLQANGTPSCLSVAGNANELWVMAQANFGQSQILRYHPSASFGAFIGYYDHTNVPELDLGFRAVAMHFDKEGRQWLGMQNGGAVVKSGSEWFKVNMASVFPPGTSVNNNAIAEDADGNIYIGTNNGLVVYEGGRLDTATSYELLTAADGLPSNNITGIAIDSLNGKILLTTDAGVCFMKRNYKIRVKLAWDHSFPALNANPRGVAADGVARLYLKIRRGNDTMPKIKEVKVELKDYEAARSNMRGRLKKAIELDMYSDEASFQTDKQASRTDSTSEGDFWFWYTAPEDFSNDSIGGYSLESERKDTLKVKVIYENLTEDSVEYFMRVVRPPLLMVHGLASGPSTWDNLYHQGDVKFVNSPLFKYKRALTMDGRGLFLENSKRLLNADIEEGPDRINSLQGNIEEIRKMGFACNQVDYLCHSMGGIMIRGAIGWLGPKFFSNGTYKYNNYGKGFVHKLIFANTPHNSSTIADAVHEFIPQLPEALNRLFTIGWKLDPNMQQPYDFIIPDKRVGNSYTFKASDAVSDLQVTDAWGGKNLPVTYGVKNHLIIGDVDLTPGKLDDLANQNKALVQLSNGLLQVARDKLADKRDQLTFLFDENFSPRQRFLMWWDFYSARKGFPDFMADGDLIVPLASETARKPETSPNITKFLNSPGSSFDASHVTILARKDVGKRVMDLLNVNVNNNALFGDYIAPNTDPEPALRGTATSNTQVVVTSHYDTSYIVIDAPSRTGVTVYADSMMPVNFRIKDTTGLAYLQINFQLNDSFRLNKNFSQQMLLKIDRTYAGPQKIFAIAVYDKAGDVEYHIDSFTIYVDTKATLQGFRIQDQMVEVTGKIPYKPKYEVKYGGIWTDLLGTDPLLQYTFNPAGIVRYDTAIQAFIGVQSGFAQAIFSYKGFADTVSFNSLMETSTEKLLFSGKVFLQGAYNTGTGSMNTTLNSSGILQSKAAAQPYADSVFNYFGGEKVGSGFFAANPTIVDWIMVELRNPELPTAVVASRAAFVKSDGTLVDTSGGTNIAFDPVPPGNYFVVIRHRNHIAIRSSATVDFSSGSGNYNFTSSLSNAFAGTVSNAPMAMVAPGAYAMWGGNTNNDNVVKMTGLSHTGNDYLKLLNILGSSINELANVYSKQDINMDGKVNMTGISAAVNDYLKLLNMLGNSVNQVSQPSF